MGTTQQSYTYAALLKDLQRLSPEQLAQQVQAWGEMNSLLPLYSLEVEASDYTCEDGECWPIEEAEQDEAYEKEAAPEIYVHKGTVLLWNA